MFAQAGAISGLIRRIAYLKQKIYTNLIMSSLRLYMAIWILMIIGTSQCKTRAERHHYSYVGAERKK
jgi:hypothetical protein